MRDELEVLDDTTRQNNLLQYILDPNTPGGQSLREFSKSEFSDENFTFIDSINILEGLKSNSLDPSPDLNIKTALETIAAQLKNSSRFSAEQQDKTAIKEVNISDAARQKSVPIEIIAVARLFDDPRVYDAKMVRGSILNIVNNLSEAKKEVINLIRQNTAINWSKQPAIIDGNQVYVYDEQTKTKRAKSNAEYFMVLADEWVKTVSPPTFDPQLDPPEPTRSRSGAVGSDDRPLDVTSLPERNRSGGIDEGRVPLPEPMPNSQGISIPSKGIPIAQEGLPETTSTSELTPMPENPLGEGNEGGGE